jgi:hypothetical protein
MKLGNIFYPRGCIDSKCYSDCRTNFSSSIVHHLFGQQFVYPVSWIITSDNVLSFVECYYLRAVNVNLFRSVYYKSTVFLEVVMVLKQSSRQVDVIINLWLGRIAINTFPTCHTWEQLMRAIICICPQGLLCRFLGRRHSI